jgi:hypothetical protein
MAAPRYIEIGGRKYLWRDILELRREQRKAAIHPPQPVLFEVKDDIRPASHRNAAGRYQESESQLFK